MNGAASGDGRWAIRLALGAALLGLAAWAAACGSDESSGANGTTGAGASGSGGGNLGGGNISLCGTCPGDGLCDPQLGCVQCIDGADCTSSGNPVCVLGHCEECGAATDCGTGQSCSPVDHTCHPACQNNADCNNGDAPLCDPATKACVECITATDCQNAPLCNPALGICVDCTKDTDCGVANPICNVPSGNCVQCLLTSQCGLGETCIGHECVPKCMSNADCNGDNDPVCDVATGQCVECATNADCGAGQPICTANHHCVECAVDVDCGAAQPVCAQNGNCVQCVVDGDCPAAEPVCSNDNGCVECQNDNDCPNNMQCDNNQCQ